LHCDKPFEKFYVFAKNRVYSVSFTDIVNKGKNLKWSGKKILTDSGATCFEDDYLNWKGNDYQTITIFHRRLFVMSHKDHAIMIFLDQKKAELMPFSGYPRSRFKMHNEFGDA
jgi:hypothetical protein